MKDYKLSAPGTGRIANALVKLCSPGQPGEHLIQDGPTTPAVCLLAANLAKVYLVDKKYSITGLSEVYQAASVTNSSALGKELKTLNLYHEESTVAFHKGDRKKSYDNEGKLLPITLETYWTMHQRTHAVNLSILEKEEGSPS